MTKTIQPDILHIEGCNFVDAPTGGQLNFSRQLLKAFGNRLALVGWASSPSEPIGCWFNKAIDGITYRYFAFGRDIPSDVKPLIPVRITTWRQIRRYRYRILSMGIPNIFIREHSILMALNHKPGMNICFYNPGVDSALSISRYPWAVRFADLFDHLFFKSLGQKASCILAAADKSAITDLKNRAGGRLRGKNIISFPTRVDKEIFHPADRLACRKILGLPRDSILAVTTGRIHWAKGWKFLLESFKLFLARFPRALLIFIGNGAEREALMQHASALCIQENIILTGYQSPAVIASYLQASNLFVMGSLKEGWSTVLVEALATGLPIVTTKFSSADSIVSDGINGFIVEREPQIFAKAMDAALKLTEVKEYSIKETEKYALSNLATALTDVWPLI